ncbi:MAG TPA: hypothetical protein VHA82_05315 [Ramlibacter sp.]|uniref:hypothetical protein n=1 Tax=Ramlibacter sp. TaxID=1917967 RepID=UPI002C16D385|nr:hypothetical protein [Ramlibacter sp.]HVZ43209.1 hypothetical protein [Ramlibacter sp.]
MRNLLPLLIACVLAACTTIAKVEGDQVVNGKLAVHVPAAWNRVQDPWGGEPYDTWTQEGMPLDHLRLWAGVQPGQALMKRPTVFFRGPGEKDRRVPTFQPGMPAEKLVSLFEELYATAGTVKLTRLAPATFAGQQGMRFEFTLARRADDLVLKGVGWVAEKDRALYAATFLAPRLGFYDRLLPMAEEVVKTARIAS